MREGERERETSLQFLTVSLNVLMITVADGGDDDDNEVEREIDVPIHLLGVEQHPDDEVHDDKVPSNCRPDPGDVVPPGVGIQDRIALNN